MGLKALLETIDDLPEEMKSLYSETKVGDKTLYALDIEDIDNHPKVRGVITANRENARKRDEYKAKVEDLEARVASLPEDFDPDEWTRLKAGEGGKPDEAIQALKDQHARAIEALKAKHSKDLQEREAAVAERDRFIDTTIRNDELRRALREAGVDMDQHEEVLLDHLGKQVKVQRTDDGKRMAMVETDLGEVPVSDFIKEWAGTKGKAYLGKASGPDPHGNNGGRGGHKTQGGDFGGDRSDRVKAIASKFPELASN